jgi:hypothetical protein
MKTMVMKRSGKRLFLSDRRAAIFKKMGVAYEDSQPVIKRPLIEAMPAEVEMEQEPQRPRSRRRYKRRDMEAEEQNCIEELNESLSFSA